MMSSAPRLGIIDADGVLDPSPDTRQNTPSTSRWGVARGGLGETWGRVRCRVEMGVIAEGTDEVAPGASREVQSAKILGS